MTDGRASRGLAAALAFSQVPTTCGPLFPPHRAIAADDMPLDRAVQEAWGTSTRMLSRDSPEHSAFDIANGSALSIVYESIRLVDPEEGCVDQSSDNR